MPPIAESVATQLVQWSGFTLDEDAIVQDAISLLAFTVLHVGPVFIVCIHAGESSSISLLVEKGRQDVFDGGLLVLRVFLDEDGGHAGIRRHGAGEKRQGLMRRQE